MLAPMDPEQRYQELVAEIQREFPRMRIVRKSESGLHRLIDRVLRVVTFGQMTSYLDGYVTTIRNTIYVTDDWDDRGALDRYCTLRHEAVHLRQFRRYTLPGMAVLYVLLPLPLGVAWFRARFEMEAYAESIRAHAELHGPAACDDRFRERILAQFLGPSYGWMWPFRGALERWYDGVLASLPATSRQGS